MEENFRKEEDVVSLIDIIRLLVSKIKVLILVVLIGGILGGAFAVWQTYDVNYYGTSVEFYVNPKAPKKGANDSESQYGVYGAYGKHVMDNMVKLLSSESFAELLILNGEILPEKDTWVNLGSSYEASLNLNGLIDAAQIAQGYADEKQAVADALQAETDEKQKAVTELKKIANETYTELQLEWKKATIHYNKYSSLSYGKAVYEAFLVDADIPEDAKYDLIVAYENYAGEQGDKTKADAEQKVVDEMQKKADEAQELATAEQKKANAEIEIALEAWRTTEAYRVALHAYCDSISYSFLSSKETVNNADSVARSFIYVNISVLNDQEFANELLAKIKNLIPEYVEANMAIPSGYEGTNCQRITRTDNIALTNAGYTTRQAIKYGLLAAIASFIIACVVIVFVDKSDKRLRDLSVITNKFNYPVLGVIPSMNVLDQSTKTETGKTDNAKTAKTEVK